MLLKLILIEKFFYSRILTKLFCFLVVNLREHYKKQHPKSMHFKQSHRVSLVFFVQILLKKLYHGYSFLYIFLSYIFNVFVIAMVQKVIKSFFFFLFSVVRIHLIVVLTVLQWQQPSVLQVHKLLKQSFTSNICQYREINP